MIGDNDSNAIHLCLPNDLPVKAEHLSTGGNRIEPVPWHHKGEVSDLSCERRNSISRSLTERQMEDNARPPGCWPWLTFKIFLSLAGITGANLIT